MAEKIAVPEFGICHQFVNQMRRNISSKFFDFYSLAHHVSDEEFNIFIAYNPALFDTDALIVHITVATKSSDLFRYHWKVHRSPVHKRDNLKFTDDDFTKEVVISFSVI